MPLDIEFYKNINSLHKYTDKYIFKHYCNSINKNDNKNICCENCFNKKAIKLQKNKEYKEYNIFSKSQPGKTHNKIKDAYEIIQKGEQNKKYKCHVHIYDIGNYSEFQKYIEENIIEYFDVFITFCIGLVHESTINKKITLIKTENKGYDIGGKIFFLDYITIQEQEQEKGEIFLFLHSKTNLIKRKQYFSIVESKNTVEENIKLCYKKLAVFPNDASLEYSYNKNPYLFEQVMKFNYQQVIEMLSFINVSTPEICEINFKKDYKFIEGNCMFLHKKIVDTVFSNNLELFYNNLNTNKTIDYNWVIHIYPEFYGKNYEYVENAIEDKTKYVGNNLWLKKTNRKYYPDAMFEHIFERLWLFLAEKLSNN